MLESASRRGGVCLGVFSSGGVCSGVVGDVEVGSAPRGVPGQGGVCSGGVSAPGGVGIPACIEAEPPL